MPTEAQVKEALKVKLMNGTMTADEAQAKLQQFRDMQQPAVQPQPVVPQQPQQPQQQGLRSVEDLSTLEVNRPSISDMSPETQTGLSAAMQSIHPILGRMVSGVLGLGGRTERTDQATELVDAPAADVGFNVGLNLALNFDQEEIENVIRESIPDASFTKDQQGNSYVTIDGKEYIVNKPGLSKQDLGTMIGNSIAFLPASRVAALGQTVMRRVGLGALASGATQTVIEGAEAATGGEFTPGEVLAATGFGAAGELPSALLQTRRLSETAVPLLPDVTPEQAAAARETLERTGTSLLPSQASKTEKDQLVNFLLFQDPSTSAQMKGRLQAQSEDVFQGAFTFLDELAMSDEASRAALDVRNLSKKAIAEARRERTRVTSPMFKQAFKEADDAAIKLDLTDQMETITQVLGKQSGKTTKRQLNELRSDIRSAMIAEGQPSNFENLHNLKRELRDKVKQETTGANRTMSDFVAGVYNDAIDAIDERLKGVSDTYIEANLKHQELSPAVDRVTGSLGNIENIPDDKLKSVATQIFDVNEFAANPTQFLNTKQLIQSANPEAWDALVRSKFRQDMIQLGIDTMEEAADPDVNFIQQMWSKSFRGGEKTMFKNALDGEMKRNYLALADVFNQTRKRPAQSATQQLTELRSAIEGKKGVARAIEALSNRDAGGLYRTITGSNQVADRNMRILADIVTDPQWMDRMGEIRRLGMGTPKGGAAFVQLFRDVLNSYGESPEDQRGQIQ